MAQENKYPHEMRLKKPVQHGSELIEVIRYREPVAKDIRKVKIGPAAEKMELGDLLDIFALISDQSPVVIGQLSAQDSYEAVGIVNGFFPDGQ